MEMDFYAALGLEAPTEGANEQEVAEPAQAEGANEQEVAEPAEAEEAEVEETESDDADEGNNAPTEVESTEQSKEERAANARRRREREQQEAISKAEEDAKAAMKAEYDKIIAAAGLTNPLDGKKPVTKIDELKEYNENRRQQQMEKDLKNGRLTPEALTAAVENSEPFQKMKAIAEQAEAAREKADGERAELAIKAQMEQIKAIDPTIKEVKDFLAMPDYPTFKGYVDRGLSYVDALRLTRYDKLVSEAAGKQAEANIAKAAGKEHLAGSKSKGRGAESVPGEVMAMYRLLNPGMSEAEYQAHYNKNKTN